MSDRTNSRYVAYARAHGREPEDQIVQDRLDWPGGSMCGFTFWNNDRLSEYHRVNPHAFMMGGSSRPAIIDHEGYDAWLETRVDELLRSDPSSAACKTCGRPLDRATDPMSRDCGGDCWGCIGKIEADGGDAESKQRVDHEIAMGIRERDGTGRTPPAPKVTT